jgi:hypothetical protein
VYSTNVYYVVEKAGAIVENRRYFQIMLLDNQIHQELI